MPVDEVAATGFALRAIPHDRCVVCGAGHPHGLRIRYHADPAGSVTADWTPVETWEGFRGLIHGGVLATALDEGMSKAVAAAGYEALTAELRVRYRRHVRAGELLRIRAWVVERRKRLVAAEATLTGGDVERAHAWARFLLLSVGNRVRSKGEAK
jgi:acyl-coenzyme A thioesterase PaaI-like protein